MNVFYVFWEVVSFSDETSLPRVGATVPILAQVIHLNSLDWYFTLVGLAQSNTTEIKSALIAELFLSLADYQRRKVWTTLRSVRVHITDPRPYVLRVDRIIDEILPSLAGRQPKSFQLARSRWISELMLSDSPSRQIRRNLLDIAYSNGILEDRTEERLVANLRRPFDLRPFEKNNKSMVSVLAGYLSKSHPVLFGAMEATDSTQPQLSLDRAEFQLSKVLAQSHAFDKGNSQAVDWIKSQRREVLGEIDPRHAFRLQPGSLPEVDSKDSRLVQAADIAAGIARELWRTRGLPAVVAAFEHVTYNGRRISESDAVRISSRLVSVARPHDRD